MISAHESLASFGEVDAFIRQLCIQATSLESPWSGRPGIGLVKRNDINFPSRADKKPFKGPPDETPPETPRGSENRGSSISWSGMVDAKRDPSEAAWQSWMDQSADLDELGVSFHVASQLHTDSDELPPVEVLRQARELGAAAMRRSAALDAMVDLQSSRLEQLPVPLVQSVLPSSTDPQIQDSATEDLLGMLQDQAAIPTKEDEMQKRIDLLRDKPSSLENSGVGRGAQMHSRLQQLKAPVREESQAPHATDHRGPGHDCPSPLAAPASATSSAPMAHDSGPSAQKPPSASKLESCSSDVPGAAGSTEVDAFLAELQDLVGTQRRHMPAPSTGASSGLDDLEAQQVQQLVERAMWSDDLSVSPAQTSDLDNRLREQWRDQWDEPDAPACSSRFAPTDLSSEVLDDRPASANPEAEQEYASKTSSLADSDSTSEDEGTVTFSTSELQQPDVQEAVSLASKLQTSLSLASDDSRRPQWLGAIAIRTAEHGLKALQGENLKLARALNKTCLSATVEAALKPGDKTKVDAFCMSLHCALAKRAAELMKQRMSSQSQKVDQVSPVSGFPDAPSITKGA